MYRPAELYTQPVTEPLSLTDVKAQLAIASSDTSHDAVLAAMIQEAREAWEHDTETVLCHQSFRIRLDSIFNGFSLPKKPVSSITSIKYYDTNNGQQTLSPSIYQLDTATGKVRLAYQQDFPVTAVRWDAWEIIYKCGYSEDSSLVPGIAKRAMLLLISYWFENRDMLISEGFQSTAPYELLVKKFMRATYP
jgi:uncharacterized phiE125 gp8 family phage protein